MLQSIESLSVAEPRLIVLSDGDDEASRRNARGHLFERFVAHLLHRFGYQPPSRSRLNVTADGIELDVTARHDLTSQPCIAECKAYRSPVPANALDAFYGKLAQARFSTPNTHGFFVALPRLTGPGDEQARHIDEHDTGFTYLNAERVVRSLRDRYELVDPPDPCPLSSDPAVIITEHGTYSAALELDSESRSPRAVQVWGRAGIVPQPVLDLLAASDYANGLRVVALGQQGTEHQLVGDWHREADSPVIVTVEGSTSDFEYQLPASPRYFVGRKRLVSELDAVVATGHGVVVLNAQSGWGKSSLALTLGERARLARGHALIIDSRTASGPRYVTEVLREAAYSAASAGVLELPETASWGSLATAMLSLSRADWRSDRGPLVIFFDQFENVFRDESLTRDFRDLALGVRELDGNLVVGFAWKTDLVDWTEGHPYRLRDEIRANARVLSLGPLGASEVNTILRRLEKALAEPLSRELRQRLREYSQGLPWLLKKLSGHLISQLRVEGIDQERLVAAGLNVQGLFDSDLAELGPVEQEALRFTARYAPLPASEVTERFPPSAIQSLVDRRLIVQVGERLDTYWDIFRDYLNSGRVPVEDSYIIRLAPVTVGRLLRLVATVGNPVSVSSVAAELEVGDNSVFNLSRELRLLGVASSDEPSMVHLVESLWDSNDREGAIRRQVAQSLRRHKAHTTFLELVERGSVDLPRFAKSLPSAFPALNVSDSTWVSYARAFLYWFEYAGLAVQDGSRWEAAPEGYEPEIALLAATGRRREKGAFPHDAPGPSLRLLTELADRDQPVTLETPAQRRAAAPLLAIRALDEVGPDSVRIASENLVRAGKVNPEPLLELMRRSSGPSAGIDVLLANPHASSAEVGEAVRGAIGAQWAEATTLVIGKHLRAWAREAGVAVSRPNRGTRAGAGRNGSEERLGLF